MDYLTPDEVKRGELEILLAFDKFAKEHGLEYSLCGGTLLGAVRHRGFIPWDDDIDICMPRYEFNRLVALAKQGVDLGPYRMSGYEIDGYPMPFVKLFDTRVRVEEGVMSKNFIEYLWIDVFPIDALPDDEQATKRAYNKSFFLRALIKTGNYKFVGAGKHWYKRVARMVIYPFVKLFRLNDWAERNLINLATSFGEFDEADYVGGFVWGYGSRERLSRKVFVGTQDVEFEGHYFPAMSGFDEYLTSVYGDYMQLPPENERRSHGIIAWCDSENEGKAVEGDNNK